MLVYRDALRKPRATTRSPPCSLLVSVKDNGVNVRPWFGCGNSTAISATECAITDTLEDLTELHLVAGDARERLRKDQFDSSFFQQRSHTVSCFARLSGGIGIDLAYNSQLLVQMT